LNGLEYHTNPCGDDNINTYLLLKLHQSPTLSYPFREIYEDQICYQRKNMCFTTNHHFHVGRGTNTGNYNQGLFC